jgi:hypothetical protein
MKGLSVNEMRDLIISVGTHRGQRKLLPINVAKLIQKSLISGSSLDEVSEQITLSKRVIQKFISLLSLPIEIQSVVGWGSDPTTISFTAAAEIARLEAENEKQILAKAALETSISVPEMKQVVQIRKRSGKSIDQSIEAVLKQRVEIERRHLIIGKLISEDLLAQIPVISQSDRNQLLSRVLVQNGFGKATYGVKLSEEFFYIVGDEEYHRRIVSLPNGFENAITDFLLKELESMG